MSTVKQSTRKRVDWRRVDATTDEDIARQIADDPDTAPESTEEDLDKAWLNLNSFGVGCGTEMADFCGFRGAWIENWPEM